MDLRDRNTYFDAESPAKYLQDYSVTLSRAIASIRAESINEASRVIRGATRVYVCGNGGSAAIADHWIVDAVKGLAQGPRAWTPKFVSLLGPATLLTALANDVSYERVFSAQLEFAGLDFLQCVIAISASGNSPNVLRAAELARDRAAKVVAFTGFDGGALAGLADVHIHVPVSNYGVVEDAHSVAMHSLLQQWWCKIRAD